MSCVGSLDCSGYFFLFSLFQNIKSPAPVILRDSTGGHIYIDDVPLLLQRVATFLEAIEAWWQAYWCFSLEYPIQLRKTCLFIEHVLVGFKGDTSVPASVRTMASKLSLKFWWYGCFNKYMLYPLIKHNGHHNSCLLLLIFSSMHCVKGKKKDKKKKVLLLSTSLTCSCLITRVSLQEIQLLKFSNIVCITKLWCACIWVVKADNLGL